MNLYRMNWRLTARDQNQLKLSARIEAKLPNSLKSNDALKL